MQNLISDVQWTQALVHYVIKCLLFDIISVNKQTNIQVYIYNQLD
jgi:hypothetical protein